MDCTKNYMDKINAEKEKNKEKKKKYKMKDVFVLKNKNKSIRKANLQNKIINIVEKKIEK